MRLFFKLNCFAMLYGFILFIQTEIILNYYRIENLVYWYNTKISTILIFVVFIISTIVGYIITNRHFKMGKIRYFLTILWIPYLILFIKFFSYYFPMDNPGEEPTNVSGLILIFIYIVYPFYIALINLICTKN